MFKSVNVGVSKEIALKSPLLITILKLIESDVEFVGDVFGNVSILYIYIFIYCVLFIIIKIL